MREITRKLMKAVRLVRTPRFRQALFKGVAATIEHEKIMSSLSPETVLDVGANKGQFSLLALELFPKRIIHAFEPLARPRAKMKAIIGDSASMHIHDVALGEIASSQTMHVTAKDDSSSLRSITELQSKLFTGTHEVGEQQVKVLPLTSCLREEELVPPVLMKLDVQGYELEALKGSAPYLKHISWIYAECSFTELYNGQALFDKVAEFLRGYGFLTRSIHNVVYGPEGIALQADILFERPRQDAH